MRRILLSFVFLLGTFVGFSQDAAEMINNANEALKAKDYTKAFSLYENAMGNIGDVQVDDAINYNIGFAAFQAGKYDATIKYMDKAIAANANIASAYEYKANAYVKLKKSKEAIDAYKKAIDSGAKDKGKLYYNAGIAAYKGKVYDQAADLFENAANENYNGEKALYYKAVVLKKQGKTDEYKAALEAGVKKYPNAKKISSSLATVYVSDANDVYKKGVDIVNAANEKVKAGSLKTTDAAYTAEVDKAKVYFQKAVDMLGDVEKIDSGNANATKLKEVCKSML